MEGSADDAEAQLKKAEALLKQKIASDPTAKAIIEALRANTGTNEREMLEQMAKAMVDTGTIAHLAEMPSDTLCHRIQKTWDSMCCVPGSKTR